MREQAARSWRQWGLHALEPAPSVTQAWRPAQILVAAAASHRAKVSDEFTVPLCRTHHREVHRVGDEITASFPF